ncbi:hypothetical protein [Candidatus Korobacter versatilis]|uniref:hypothetical protein n=1 Tax=Candidatus Korobacter versatilis TaxID=658062 RepID=UPI000309F6BD|nr:hypothetical protein [Candidatus Koribacter versatilis]
MKIRRTRKKVRKNPEENAVAWLDKLAKFRVEEFMPDGRQQPKAPARKYFD